jgi:hypothetical protein
MGSGLKTFLIFCDIYLLLEDKRLGVSDPLIFITCQRGSKRSDSMDHSHNNGLLSRRAVTNIPHKYYIRDDLNAMSSHDLYSTADSLVP